MRGVEEGWVEEGIRKGLGRPMAHFLTWSSVRLRKPEMSSLETLSPSTHAVPTMEAFERGCPDPGK